MSRELTLLIGWLGGALFALLMLWAMWWALFADRSRGERRCPRCWHLMDAAVGLRCSECGLQVKHERALFATRRRWRLAALALAALVAGTVYLRFTIANDGWWTLLPNRALLTMLPWLPADGDAGDVRSELRSRLAKGLVSERDCLRMLEMVRDGDATAPAGSDLWMRTYGGWLDALRNRWASADPDDALRLAATTLPPLMLMDLPSTWPTDQSLVTINRVADWWPEGVQVRIRVAGVDGLPLQPEAINDLLAYEWTRAERRGFGDGFAMDFGTLPQGPQRGTLRMHWETRDRLHGDRVMASGECAVPMQIDITGPATPLAGVDDADMQALMRQVFDSGMLRREGPAPQYAFSYRIMLTDAPELASTAFGLVVEACENGVPRRTLRVWWRGGGVRELAGWDPPVEDLPRLANADESPAWTLRIRGDQRIAQRAALPINGKPATQFWSGAIEVPLKVTTMPATQPGRSWTLERKPSAPPR
ncbi:MAG: hypothetical protein RLZZ288_153 [Planctomycetota bacterium]